MISGKTSAVVTVCSVLSALALMVLVAIQVLIWTDGRAAPQYEYKILAVSAEGYDRTGEDAMKFTTVTPKETELSKLGAAGWEVVGTYLEMETAFPNFGKAEYVTGLQTNVRPQRLVMILRHRSQ